MNNGRKEFTFLWFIEHYSYSWHQNGVSLNSPEFTADGLEGTAWYLRLFPRGYEDEDKGNISLILNRSEADDGPEEFPLKYELSVLSANGSEEFEFTMKRGFGFGTTKIVQLDEGLMKYLPEDTLRVRCKMWTGNGHIEKMTEITATTRIGIEQISFLHVVEGFSSMEANQKKTIRVKSPSTKELTLSSSLYFTDNWSCRGKIMVEIHSYGFNQRLPRCKLSLLDGSGNVIGSGEADYRFDATRRDTHKLSLPVKRQSLLQKKSNYLPGDKLSLSCDCIFSTGVEYENIDRVDLSKSLMDSNQINNNDQSDYIYNALEKLSECPSALDDFKSIYNKQLLTDVELKTKTKSFLAHKIVLCARSPVFKMMLANSMNEKNTGCIDMQDLEDNIVEQLLFFLYSDNLENLQWDSAIKLYYAGNKYEIEKLKLLCSIFLVENLSTVSASELLLLAETHNDSELKRTVEYCIFKNEEQVSASEESGSE